MIKHRQKKIASGTTKNLFEVAETDKALLSFEDTVRGGESLSGKGILNNRISAHLMTCLESIGLPTHFLKSLNMREQEVRLLDPMPLVFRVRNVAAGSICERLSIDEGTVLPRPIIEFYHKKKAGDYTLVTEDHIMAFQWACLRLYGTFGELYLMVMDELSPDSMRLWDVKTNKPFTSKWNGY